MKIYELSNGTIQVLRENGIIDSYNCFSEFEHDVLDYFEAEYFQIENVYPLLFRKYFDNKDLLVFENGRKILTDLTKYDLYKNKYIESEFKIADNLLIFRFVELEDGETHAICGIETSTISTFKIKKVSYLFS